MTETVDGRPVGGRTTAAIGRGAAVGDEVPVGLPREHLVPLPEE